MSTQTIRPERSLMRMLAAVAVFAAMIVSSAVQAHDPSKHGAGAAPPPAPGPVDVSLLELEVLDRNGDPLMFKSEAIGDRIVAIDFVYTSCTTICPVLSALFAQVQDQLGDRVGKDVWLVSISVDPTRDTPRRMAAQAEQFGAAPGWLWLTGPKNNVDRVLAGLDAYTPLFEDHASMILIGDAKHGTWRRLFGFPDPDDIVAIIDEFAAARGETHAKIGD